MFVFFLYLKYLTIHFAVKFLMRYFQSVEEKYILNIFGIKMIIELSGPTNVFIHFI